MISLTDSLDYACIPYESLNKPLTLRMLEDKAYRLSRTRQEHNYSGDIKILLPPSLLLSIANEIFDKMGYARRSWIPITGLRYQFMHLIPWISQQPGICTMLLQEDIINRRAFTPDCHYVYLNCQPQQAIDYQI